MSPVSNQRGELNRAHLDVIGPAVLLLLPFDPVLDQLQCLLPGGALALHLSCCVESALVQRGAEALGQGVAPRTSQGPELALGAVFGIWGRRSTAMREEEEER